MTAGDRQLVREAVAAYFGGALETADAGIYFQNGPLVSSGLGTAFPYKVKASAPDQFYTQGMAAGAGWGAVMTVSLGRTAIGRMAEGGPTSGWRQRKYTTRCSFEVLSYEPHLETAEAGLDNLVDAWLDLLYLDRTLGTTSATYPTGRLITQAGEGRAGIDVSDPDEWQVLDEQRGKAAGGIAVTFECLTMVEA